MLCFMQVKLSTISTVVVPNNRMEPQRKSVAFCLSNESNYRVLLLCVYLCLLFVQKLISEYRRIVRPVHTFYNTASKNIKNESPYCGYCFFLRQKCEG